MKVLKIKASDIVSFYDGMLQYGEVGPGKKHTDDDYEFEVYPIRETGLEGYFEYMEDPIWVNYSSIVTHQSVRNRMDFQDAWISLEFKPVITDDNIYLERLFEIEPSELPMSRAFDNVDELYTSDDDDNRSLRSVDTYSTEEDSLSSDDDSFIVHSDHDSETIEECDRETSEECDCDYCKVTRESVKWCDNDWNPKDPTEKKVQSFIEYLENKYT